MIDPKLNNNTIIIVKKDFIITGTGLTFYFYQGQKYKIIKYLSTQPLSRWKEPAWEIRLIERSKWQIYDARLIHSFSETELFEKFECVKYTRLKKLEKLQKCNLQKCNI